MAVAARFKIESTIKNESTEGVLVSLSATVDRVGNEDWAKYTPAGQISMNVNGPAGSWFEERRGQVVALTFDDAPTTEEN